MANVGIDGGGGSANPQLFTWVGMGTPMRGIVSSSRPLTGQLWPRRGQ